MLIPCLKDGKLELKMNFKKISQNFKMASPERKEKLLRLFEELAQGEDWVIGMVLGTNQILPNRDQRHEVDVQVTLFLMNYLMEHLHELKITVPRDINLPSKFNEPMNLELANKKIQRFLQQTE